MIDMKNEEDKQNDIVGSYLISDKYILEWCTIKYQILGFNFIITMRNREPTKLSL